METTNIEKYINEQSKMFDKTDIEKLHLIFSKNDECESINISKSSNLKSTKILPIKDIINILLNNEIKYYYLCHNHPNGTPFFSENDYLATRNLYIISKIFNIELKNHYIICGKEIFISFNINDAKLICINKYEKYEQYKNFYKDKEIKQYIENIQQQFKEIINDINLENNNEKRLNKLSSFIIDCYDIGNKDYDDIFELNTLNEFVLTGTLTEYDMKPLSISDNQLKNTFNEDIKEEMKNINKNKSKLTEKVKEQIKIQESFKGTIQEEDNDILKL